ncbi:MAG: NAD(P)/FAD-dependent oxidoreductase [Candidatus Hydrogenedentes bacterium]|nr:NAD(P)/FAD-dependent oxidoreductase [Candidatus Hydrogenedentota bacterium]
MVLRTIESPTEHRVVIVGGGFAGLFAAQSLRKAPVRITLIDARNFHLFQPLLYQVATGALSPANIASPLRAILAKQKNAQVLMGEVTDIDVENQRVFMGPNPIEYDTLIVATGASHAYFGHSEWGSLAPGLKTIEDATDIRRRILTAFEMAECSSDPDEIHELLTFVIVGAGPTGVELAGALREIAYHTLQAEFRKINPSEATVMLLSKSQRILPMYSEDLSASAENALKKLKVVVRTGVEVTDIRPGSVTFLCGKKRETVETRTVLWAAGVKASPLGKLLADRTGASLDSQGRVKVEADNSLPNHPNIFVAGDLANYCHGTEQPLPGLAAVAMQQGQYIAKLIASRVNGHEPPGPFKYHDWGTMATIGRGAAIADFKGWHLTGLLAWLTWLFIHLMKIVQFENRLLIFMQWAWNYLTWDRTACLITNVKPQKPPEP